MKKIYPSSLKYGAHLRVIAPSCSMRILSQETIDNATNRFKNIGFNLSFGQHTNEINVFKSSSIESRIIDFHEAFADPNVNGIITAIGGHLSNQLLEFIDWNLIKNNPKFFCGYSDITILHNAILKNTGLVSYYGPHFSTFGQRLLDPYTIDYFLKIFKSESFFIEPSHNWSNDAWYLDQEKSNLLPNDGYWILQEGNVLGEVIGGHLGTLSLLFGTQYMPCLSEKILILEEDAEPTNPSEFDRRLQSLLQQPKAEEISGILIGRFERAYGMTKELLMQIIKTKKNLHNKPVIANIDFGHTEPHCTIPIGGMVELIARKNQTSIKILNY